MSSTPIIVVKGLGKTVRLGQESLTILEGIDLQVNTGETLALVGASGSGKSTLLGLLAGLDLPSQGDIEILGQSLVQLDEEGRARLRADQVGFVLRSKLRRDPDTLPRMPRFVGMHDDGPVAHGSSFL